MKLFIAIALLSSFVLFAGCGDKKGKSNKKKTTKASKSNTNPVVVIKTSLGTMTAELYPEKAPITVKNFLRYVDDKHYNNMIFHRVIHGFMIQCGGFIETEKGIEKPNTRISIQNEAANGLSNARGTLAMARTGEIHSATNQFYINHKDNRSLDNSPQNFGYAVFGKLLSGYDVLDKIASVKTGRKDPFQSDVPLETITILSIRRK